MNNPPSEKNTLRRNNADILLLAEAYRRHDQALVATRHDAPATLPPGFNAAAMQRIQSVQARHELRVRVLSWICVSVVCLCGMVAVAVVCMPVFRQTSVLLKATVHALACNGAYLLSVTVCFVFLSVLNSVFHRHFHSSS